MGGAGAPLSAKFAMGQVFRIVRFSQKNTIPKNTESARQSCCHCRSEVGIISDYNAKYIDHDATFYHRHAHPTMDAPR